MKTKDRYMAECKICFYNRVKNLRPKYKEYDSSYAKEYKQKNYEKIRNRERSYQKEYMRKRRLDPIFKLKENLRTYFYRTLTYKTGGVFVYLGCSIEEFKLYLELMFDKEMNWENHGSIWHIDHIKPCCSYNLVNEDELKACFHWSNLRPLLVLENQKKTNKIDEELIKEYKILSEKFLELYENL
jgi:hypothetical protein